MSHLRSRPYYRLRTFYRRLRAFLGRGWLSERTRIVVHGSTEPCQSPIFIVGTHRSGTSLLRRVLDSHRNIACPPESFWLTHYTRILDDHLAFDGFWNLGFDRQEAIGGLRQGAAHFHEAYRLAKGKSRWADKTPQYAEHLDTLWTLFGPEARFVFIFRHPMDVAFSIWKRGWNFVDTTGDAVTDCSRYVVGSGQRQLAFLNARPEVCHVIYYDQLVGNPEAILGRLCADFLNEPWDPRMLRHHQVPHDFGCEDPMVRGTRGFHGSFENWHEWSARQIDRAIDVLGPLMTQLGYTLDSPFVSRNADRCCADDVGWAVSDTGVRKTMKKFKETAWKRPRPQFAVTAVTSSMPRRQQTRDAAPLGVTHVALSLSRLGAGVSSVAWQLGKSQRDQGQRVQLDVPR